MDRPEDSYYTVCNIEHRTVYETKGKLLLGASLSGLRTFRSSFAARTVGDWNQLPAAVVEQESPAAFKKSA